MHPIWDNLLCGLMWFRDFDSFLVGGLFIIWDLLEWINLVFKNLFGYKNLL